MQAPANSKQVGGRHYQTSRYQHWDFASDIQMPYLLGCATKYLVRWPNKGGIQDLEKSMHYIEKAIEKFPMLYAAMKQCMPEAAVIHYYTESFIKINSLGNRESEAYRLMLYSPNPTSWKRARESIHYLIIQARQEGAIRVPDNANGQSEQVATQEGLTA